jgi:peptidoglycan/LPS O-acetylase OafA/YrhL
MSGETEAVGFMKSTSGAHFIALDHVRAVAAFMVFCWHFMHGREGYPVKFASSPIWGFALFDEGHVGVALFMTLSGYLFAKLLNSRSIIYHWFIWNRLLRLMPLLLIIIIVNAAIQVIISGDVRSAYWYLLPMFKGFIFPVWPNGGWSITVELHFYLLLPILLVAIRRSNSNLWILLALAITLRATLYAWVGSVQDIAYHTIVGRFDQFLLGISAFYSRQIFYKQHLRALFIFAMFLTFYWWFDSSGGYHRMPSDGVSAKIWVLLPTIEGLAFASLIAWYDSSFTYEPGPISNLMAKMGEYSYSIYLLHFFFVFAVAEWLHIHVIDLSNFYVALLVSLVAFLCMAPVGYISLRFVERPFLELRRPYIR